MVGMALVKSLYAIPTWSRTAGLVAEHSGLQSVLGCRPSVYACYRFATELRVHSDKLDGCIARVLASLRAEHPDMGRDVAIDASDLPAFANGQRYVSKGGRERDLSEYSDPDASWGHRSAVSTRKGGGFYGYKVDMAVCSRTGLPVAWQTRTAKANESNFALPLIDAARERGFNVETAAMDKGYDMTALYDGCEDRGIRPIMPLRLTSAVKAGADEPPTCEHGRWQFAGSDYKRKASKWRCPTGECQPGSREFGRLKHEWALLPLRVRGIERVQLHADLTILAKLASALARARAVPPRSSRRASPAGYWACDVGGERGGGAEDAPSVCRRRPGCDARALGPRHRLAGGRGRNR
jgi:hypothetical protein